MMRKAPIFLAGLFIAITLTRVAEFSAYMGAGILGWLFSTGLGVAVYTSSFFLRWQTTRRVAVLALTLFILADGFFNLAEVLRTVRADTWYLQVGAWIYGLFPTVAAAVLGILQSYADKLPSGSHGAGGVAEVAAAVRRLAVGLLDRAAGSVSPAGFLQAPAQDTQVYMESAGDPVPVAAFKYNCQYPGCEWGTDDPKAVGGHARRHRRNGGTG